MKQQLKHQLREFQDHCNITFLIEDNSMVPLTTHLWFAYLYDTMELEHVFLWLLFIYIHGACMVVTCCVLFYPLAFLGLQRPCVLLNLLLKHLQIQIKYILCLLVIVFFIYPSSYQIKICLK